MKREVIEALLKEAGVAEDKIKGAVDVVVAEHTKDIEAEQAKTIAKDGELTKANETIVQLQQTVKAFDGKDPLKLEADLKQLQEKYKADIATEQQKAQAMQKEMALKEALRTSGVTDPEYLIFKAGGVEKFAFADGKPVGLADTIKPYQESHPHLFGKAKPDGEEGIRVDSGGEHGGSGIQLDAFLAGARKGAGLPATNKE